jgi:hypothetical protein
MSYEKYTITELLKTIFILAFTLIASTQLGFNTLYQISTNTLAPYGYPGEENSAKAKFYTSLSIRLIRILSKIFSLETGLGYRKHNDEIGSEARLRQLPIFSRSPYIAATETRTNKTKD